MHALHATLQYGIDSTVPLLALMFLEQIKPIIDQLTVNTVLQSRIETEQK